MEDRSDARFLTRTVIKSVFSSLCILYFYVFIKKFLIFEVLNVD